MSGMVEKRGLGMWLTHAGLILGIAVMCFPIWLAFVASTVTQAQIVAPVAHTHLTPPPIYHV